MIVLLVYIAEEGLRVSSQALLGCNMLDMEGAEKVVGRRSLYISWIQNTSCLRIRRYQASF